MHEIGIAQNILDIVDQELKQRNICRSVQRVDVKIGKLNAIIPEMLVFNFNVLRRNYGLLKYAMLHIEQVPIQAVCKACQFSAVIEEPVFVCSACGGSLHVEQGDSMFIDEIVVEDIERSSDLAVNTH